MTIRAKFPSKCTECGCGINVGEEILWQRGVRGVSHANVNACAVAKNTRLAREASATTAPKLDLAKIVEFLKAAQARGLKSPKIRVLDLDGKTELRLGLTTKGVAPGSVSVSRANAGFVGCVRPDGTCTSDLAGDADLKNHILRVAEDPVSAAKEYAAVMGLCTFCAKQLTDEGSTEVGYGPICAGKYGLPHHPKGTPSLRQVPA